MAPVRPSRIPGIPETEHTFCISKTIHPAFFPLSSATADPIGEGRGLNSGGRRHQNDADMKIIRVKLLRQFAISLPPVTISVSEVSLLRGGCGSNSRQSSLTAWRGRKSNSLGPVDAARAAGMASGDRGTSDARLPNCPCAQDIHLGNEVWLKDAEDTRAHRNHPCQVSGPL